MKKKSLSGLNKQLVLKTIEESLSNYPNFSKESSSADKKFLLKEIRKKLRILAGRFRAESSNLKACLELLNQNKIDELLNLHTSTSERINKYDMIRKEVYKLSPKTILDLGCGLNPLALARKDVEYTAVDIQTNDLEVVS